MCKSKLEEDLSKLLKNNYSKNLNLNVHDIDTYIAKIVSCSVIVAHYERGCLLGFISYYANDFDNRTTFLTMILLDSSIQGRGLGMNLLDYWLTNARLSGFQYAVLKVNTQNTIALNLFSELGFKVINTSVTEKKLMKNL